MRGILFLCSICLLANHLFAQKPLPIWFSEDFSDNSNRWDDWQEQNEWVHNNALYVHADKDFQLLTELDASELKENDSYGLSWGRKSLYHYFYFEINQKQQFRIGYCEDGIYYILKNWKRSRKIQKTTNQLKIRREGKQLLFYINDKKVHKHSFIPFFGTEVSIRSSNPSLVWNKFEIYQEMGEINVNENVKNYQTQKENLGPNINSAYIDKFPMISPDGKTLYYLREEYPGDYGGQDIWYATADQEGNWNKGKNMGKDLNNNASNFVNAVLPDNNTLCLNNTYVNAGPESIIAFSQRTKNGWSSPLPIPIRRLQKQGRWVSFFLAADGRTLVFTMLRPDSYGGRDLYVSFLESDGSFSVPRNLGPTLNSPGNEHCPFLAADGKTLYFDSDGHPGYGGRDIFVSRRLDDSWTNWSIPENMGPAINSTQSDEGLIIPASGEYAYFVSNENSLGALDIYRLRLPEELKPAPTALLRAVVTECNAQKPIGTLIRVYQQNKEIAYANSDPNTGQYQLALPAGQQYQVVVEVNEAKYKRPDTLLVDLRHLDHYSEIDLNSNCLRLKKPPTPIQVDSSQSDSSKNNVPLPQIQPIYFDFDQYQLRPSARKQLDSTYRILQEYPQAKLDVIGHTDAIGTLTYNQQLSEKRVASVIKYLKNKGLEEIRIKASWGKGETDPIDRNDNTKGRAKNRRVSFQLYSH